MLALAITLIAVAALSIVFIAGCTWQSMHSTPTPQPVRRRPIVWNNN